MNVPYPQPTQQMYHNTDFSPIKDIGQQAGDLITKMPQLKALDQAIKNREVQTRDIYKAFKQKMPNLRAPQKGEDPEKFMNAAVLPALGIQEEGQTADAMRRNLDPNRPKAQNYAALAQDEGIPDAGAIAYGEKAIGAYAPPADPLDTELKQSQIQRNRAAAAKSRQGPPEDPQKDALLQVEKQIESVTDNLANIAGKMRHYDDSISRWKDAEKNLAKLMEEGVDEATARQSLGMDKMMNPEQVAKERRKLELLKSDEEDRRRELKKRKGIYHSSPTTDYQKKSGQAAQMQALQKKWETIEGVLKGDDLKRLLEKVRTMQEMPPSGIGYDPNLPEKERERILQGRKELQGQPYQFTQHELMAAIPGAKDLPADVAKLITPGLVQKAEFGSPSGPRLTYNGKLNLAHPKIQLLIAKGMTVEEILQAMQNAVQPEQQPTTVAEGQ